jgi:hypothetical protein
VTFTIPRWFVPFGLLLLGLAVSADSCSGTANTAEQNQVLSQQGIYNRHNPVPTYQYSSERAALIQILNQRTSGTLNTWTVWYSNSGVPLGMCASKGYPIPYSTELTNPQQATYTSGGSGITSVAQMDPQGTYPSQSTLATWILCLSADGSIHPQYVEPLVIAYTYPVEIRGGLVVQTGSSSSESTVTLGSGR